MPLILHHLNNSRSQRILWLLEELGVDYELRKYQRGSDLRAPESLKEHHPLGKSPLITTEEGKVIAESGTILKYIINKYGNGRFKPTSAEREIDDSYWAEFSEATMMPNLVMKLIFSIVPTRSPFLVRPLVSSICSGISTTLCDGALAPQINMVEAELKKAENGGWFAGGDASKDPTLADFMMIFPLETAVKGGRADSIKGIESLDAIRAYVEKIHARPAYQRALEKGGPYRYA